VKPEEMALAKQWTGKHFSMAMNVHIIIEPLDVVFDVQFISYQTFDM
jgi:hypothetical protein